MAKNTNYVPPAHKKWEEPLYKEEPILPPINWQRLFNLINFFKKGRKGGKDGRKK